MDLFLRPIKIGLISVLFPNITGNDNWGLWFVVVICFGLLWGGSLGSLVGCPVGSVGKRFYATIYPP